MAEMIRKENEVYYSNLGVIKVWWPKAAFKPGEKGYLKKYSSIIVELITPEEVNRVRQKGLISEGTLLLYERWERNCDIRQCFNCQGYGHKGTSCPHKAQCGHFAGSHNTRDHQGSSYQVKCAVCGGNYEAWSKDCSIRVKEVQKLRRKLEGKATLYKTEGLRRVEITGQGKEDPKDTEGYTRVQNPKKMAKKRKTAGDSDGEETATPARRGRPRKLLQKELGQQTLVTGPRRSPEEESQGPQLDEGEAEMQDPIPSTL